MRADRLLTLADFLDGLDPDLFDFAAVTCRDLDGCLSVACAVGWTPRVFPDLVEWARGTVRMREDPAIFGYVDVAARLFEISAIDADALFTPWTPSPADGSELGDDASPRLVARRIRRYVELMARRIRYVEWAEARA